MLYNSQNPIEPTRIRFGTNIVDGASLDHEIVHLAQLIAERDASVKPLLGDESLVISIQGGYGAGKTWASWLFVNYLRESTSFAQQDKLHIFPFELLSFNNINESVSNILSSIAGQLWDEGVVDVREEFSQMIVDASPNHYISAQFSLLGLSLSRNITLKSHHKKNKLALKEKMAKLYGKNHRFIVILDELDRMKPDEVIVVTRMIENFRDIPGIVFVLPFYERAVVSAIKASLNLDDTSAHVFLRKFIKAKINIKLTVSNLEFSFRRMTNYGNHGANNGIMYSRYGMNTDELLWCILMHFIILTETIAAITDGGANTQKLQAHYGSPASSTYLARLRSILEKSRDARAVAGEEDAILPYATDGKLKRLGEVYGNLVDTSTNANTSVMQLRSLLNEEMLVGNIYDAVSHTPAFRETREPDFDSSHVSSAQTRTVFEALVMPALAYGPLDETKITDNYSRRDIEQLSESIFNDPDFVITQDPVDTLKRLIRLVRQRFEELR